MGMARTKAPKPVRVTPVAAEMARNFRAYRASTVPSRKREESRKACRGLAGRAGD